MPPSQRAGRACAAIGRGTMLLAMAGTTTASSVKRWRDAGAPCQRYGIYSVFPRTIRWNGIWLRSFRFYRWIQCKIKIPVVR